jgi:glycosyltransferase involved in cell wall biosynthesis
MKPRVVILTSYYRPIMGGVESNAERLALFLKASGYPVTVVTKRIGGDLPDRDVLDGVDVERIGPSGPRSAAGKWQLVPAAAHWLINHASSHDVVCCIDYRGVAVGALLARAWTGHKVLVQAQTTGVLSGANADSMLAARGIASDGAVARAMKWPGRAIYGRADAFACISHEIEREVLGCGIPRNRVHYLPNAIDMSKFKPASSVERDELRRRFDVPADAVVCLFVGRLSREKGLMELMQAWRLVAPARAVLLVVGPDMDDHPWNVGPAARAFTADNRLTASVRFLGPMVDVRPALGAADVFVQPSHFEALGLSAIEALASGLPVVASAVGGLLEFVVDGQNGRLCPAEDPPALAAALGPLVSDAGLRQRLAAGARRSVVDEYDERVVFGRFASVIDRLAGATA